MKKQLISILLTILAFTAINAQNSQHTVTGTVYAENGSSILEGATITPYLQDNFSLNLSDEKGNYTIELSTANEPYTVSYPGYKTKTIYPNGKPELHVWLQKTSVISITDPVQLQFASKTEAIKTEILDATTAKYETIDEVYQDITGVYTENRSGAGGEGMNTLIHGLGGLKTLTNPLIVIDGLPLSTYNFDNSVIGGFDLLTIAGINPLDVESISILKDAAATNIYGIKGSNGVVYIKTRYTTVGQTAIELSTNTGFQYNQGRLPLLNADQHSTYLRDQMFSAGYNVDEINTLFPFVGTDESAIHPAYQYNTNWQEEVFERGLLNNYHLALKGGDETAKFYVSAGLTDNTSVLNNTKFQRISTRLNSSILITEWLKMEGGLGFSYMQNDRTDQGAFQYTNPVISALTKTPMTGVLETLESGEVIQFYSDADDIYGTNPVALLNNALVEQNNYSLLGNYTFEISLPRNLNLYTNIGIELNQNDENVFMPDKGVAQLPGVEAQNEVRKKLDKFFSVLNQTWISYNKENISGHNYSADLGFRFKGSQIIQDIGLSLNTGSDQFTSIQYGTNGTFKKAGYWERFNWLNYFGKVNYNYRQQYFATLSLSADGSSRFGSEVDGGIGIGDFSYAVLPALSLGWDLARSEFLQDQQLFNQVLIRTSAGYTANDFFGNYLAKNYYVASQYYNVTGLSRGGLMNTGTKWELHRTLNVGLDLSLLRNRVELSVDAFNTKVSDMLVSKSIEEYYGFDSYLTNEGEALKTGFEMDLNAKIIDGRFKWIVGATLMKYQTTLTSLPNEEIIDIYGAQKINKVDEAPGQFYGLKYLGVIPNTETATSLGLKDKFDRPFTAGDAHFDDLDGNNIIDENDYQIIGDPNPGFFGYIDNTFAFGNLSLTARIHFVKDREVFNYVRSELEGMTGFENQSLAVMNRWRFEDDETTIPKLSYGDPMGNSQFSSRWIEDGSFIKLQELTLNYHIPSIGEAVKKMNIYVSASNLATMDEYLGYDPEFSYGFGYETMGIDYGKIPALTKVMIGLKISF